MPVKLSPAASGECRLSAGDAMKMLSNWFFSGLLALAWLINPDLALAQPPLPQLSQCAWPIEFSPEGYGNFLAPDEQARYWIVPFDTNYDTMKIEGSYPNARYFSFVVYDTSTNAKASWQPVSVEGHKYDAIITPDPSPANSSYTLCVTRNGAQCTNTININNDPAWVLLRLYVPSADKTLSGQALMGGQPLPKITLLGSSGSQALEACPLTKVVSATDTPPPYLPVPLPPPVYYYDKSVNRLDAIRAFFDILFPTSPTPLDIYTPSDWYEAAGGQLWFAPPKDPPILLLPNPDNKYLAMQPGPYQGGRIIVIHGKAPSFWDTHEGSAKPSWGSRSPDVRYWSVCNTDLALPVPNVRCMADDQAAVTQDGYYTLVISDDLLRPAWLQPNVNWLPWGDEQYPKLVFVRNLIPVARNDTNYTTADIPFPYAIQWVIKGCPGNCQHPQAVINFTLPYVPQRADFNAAGPYAQQIMGDYYPVAAWCNQSTFVQGGWQACIKGR
jgi:hypothetical protein